MTPAAPSAAATAPSVAVVVPVLDEADRVEGLLRRLAADVPGGTVVVVDGGSTDGTPEIARATAASLPGDVRVVTSERGRGRQLNRGAAETDSDVLWFVHADTVLAPGALDQLRAALADPEVVGGGLTLRFDRSSPGLRYLAWTSNVRARRLSWIFGDQAMFVRRPAFEAVGGYPDLPIMEDLELSRRLARVGRLAVLPATSTASARRFEQHGVWRMLVFMQWLKALHFAGVDAQELARRYALGPWPRRRTARRPPTAPPVPPVTLEEPTRAASS